MAEKDESKKPRYETPIVVPLGETAKGQGTCGAGSTNQPACSPGGAADFCDVGGDA
jgi:hypothetical protein